MKTVEQLLKKELPKEHFEPNIGPTVHQMIEDFNNKHEQGE